MRKNLALLFGVEFLRDAFYASLFLFVPFIAKDLGLSLIQAGFLQTFIYIVGLILSVPIGIIIEKVSGMKILVFCILAFAFTFLGLFFSSNYFTLLIAFLFAGIGVTIYGSLGHGLLTKIVDAKKRGKLIGIMMAFGDIGKVIAAWSFAFFITRFTWKTMNLTLGIIFLFLFVFYFFANKNTKKIENKSHSSKKTSLSTILLHKEFFYVILAGALDMFANNPLYFLLPFLLLSKGLSAQYVGLLTGTYFIGNTISRLVFGKLVDVWGSAKVFITIEIIMAILLVLLVQASSLFWIAVYAILLGFITEGSDPATVTMTAKVADKFGSFEKVFNIRATANRVAILISPLVLGFIGDHFSISFSFYTIALAVLIAIIPASMLLKLNSHK